jgi:hypothetical protein
MLHTIMLGVGKNLVTSLLTAEPMWTENPSKKKKSIVKIERVNFKSKTIRYAIEIERVDVENWKCRLPLNINEPTDFMDWSVDIFIINGLTVFIKWDRIHFPSTAQQIYLNDTVIRWYPMDKWIFSKNPIDLFTLLIKTLYTFFLLPQWYI